MKETYQMSPIAKRECHPRCYLRLKGGKFNIHKDLRVNRQIQIENPFIELHETDMHEVEMIKTGLETKLETDSNIGNLTHLLNCEKSDYKTTRNFS